MSQGGVKLLEVKLYDLGYCYESEYTRVVCVSKYKDKYVFCVLFKELVMFLLCLSNNPPFLLSWIEVFFNETIL